MDKVAKGMTKAGREAGCCSHGDTKGGGIAHSIKHMVKEAVRKIGDSVKGSAQSVKR